MDLKTFVLPWNNFWNECFVFVFVFWGGKIEIILEFSHKSQSKHQLKWNFFVGVLYDEIFPRISTSFMVVVFSWILIVCSFISWELTFQIDVSLNWVPYRDTWGITLLTLACLCCSASGDVLFALMGSINSASFSIIIALPLARSSSTWSTSIYSFIYSPETVFCKQYGGCKIDVYMGAV